MICLHDDTTICYNSICHVFFGLANYIWHVFFGNLNLTS
uniref:Uncharacterized protein MANES_18G126900 n=1 Tax=Rhizophora mucronata TaxID=61149 RepID=A0A2P2MTJ5_RHIMU